MKISKFLLSTLLFLSTALTFAQQTYTVTAKSGLSIREEPSPNGQKIGKLAYGMVVELLEKTDVALTVVDEGKQVHGNWVKISFGHIPEVNSNWSTGFVFDGYLKKATSAAGDSKVDFQRELVIYKLDSSENTPNGKLGFVSLTDAYTFEVDDTSLVIAKEHLGEQEFKDDNYHELIDLYRSRFLKSLGIRETDSIFIYHFLSDAVFTAKVSTMPVVAKINPYGAQTPVRQYDYMIGFEIGEMILCLDDIKNYYSDTLVAIGNENPFVKGQLRPVLWEKVNANRFPKPEQVAIDSTENKDALPNDTFEFKADGLHYFLQNRTKKGRLHAMHLKVLASDSGTLLFDKVFDTLEGEMLFPLNIIDDKKQVNQIAVWTGKLFKNKPPMITDFIGHSFGCSRIYFLEQSEPPIRIRCDNRH